MTYIKPETTSNQIPSNQSAFSIKEVLNLGLVAAQRQDWLVVNNYLKLLPQNKNRRETKLFLLGEEDWQIAFNLAVEMLIRADFQHKWEISKLFPLFGENIIPPLTTLVKDETVEADVRWFICQILGQFENETVVLTLVELLQQTTDSELITIAGKTLSKIGNTAIDALVKLLDQPEYRFLAVRSLFYIRTTQTIEPLLKIALDPQPELRALAIKALGSFHAPRVIPVLITALQDIASNVRKEAAIALGFRPDLCHELNLVTHLQPLLYDLNLEVCRQAAVSLGRMKQEAATTALFTVLQAETTPISLKVDLVKALGWSEISSAINYLRQALASSSELVTQEIITALGRITVVELKPQAAQALVDFWHDKNYQSYSPTIKQALATSLGELRCNCAQQTLEQLAIDEERKVKLHALAALKKLP